MVDFNILLKAKDQASAAIKKVREEFVGLSKTVKENEKRFKRAGLAGAGMLATLGLITKGAATQRRTQKQLAAALANVGVSYANVGDELERVIAAQQTKTGVSDEDQRESLRILVGTLGSYDKALQALPAVLDAAAFAGTGLRETSKTLSRALAGQVNTAESVGITFDKTADFGERLGQVLEIAGGQAEASRDPFDALLNSLADIGDDLGTAFLPLVEKVATKVGELAEFVNDLDAETIKTIAAIAGGAGITLALAGLIPIITATVVAIGNMSLATALATGGLSVLAGLAGVAALEIALNALDDPIDAANTKVKVLGEESGKTATKADEASTALDKMADATAKLQDKAQSAADKALVPLRKGIDDILVSTGQAASSEQVALQIADTFGLLEGFDVGNGREQFGKFGKLLDSFGDRLDQLKPKIREGLTDSLKGAVDVLGITARDVKDQGGNVSDALNVAFEGLDEQGKETFRRLVQGVGEELSQLDVETAFVTSADEAKAGAEKLSDETLPVVTTFVDSAVSKAAELVPAFEDIGKGLPFALAAGINQMSGVLEQAFNSVLLEFLRQTMDQLDKAAKAIGAPSPFVNVRLPGGIELPRVEVPALARGARSFAGGRALVGELGPELVDLPGGASVTPANRLLSLVQGIDRLTRGGVLAGGANLSRLARGGMMAGAGVAASGAMLPGQDAFGAISGGGGRGGGFVNYGTFQLMASSDAQSRDILDSLVTA